MVKISMDVFVRKFQPERHKLGKLGRTAPSSTTPAHARSGWSFLRRGTGPESPEGGGLPRGRRQRGWRMERRVT